MSCSRFPNKGRDNQLVPSKALVGPRWHQKNLLTPDHIPRPANPAEMHSFAQKPWSKTLPEVRRTQGIDSIPQINSTVGCSVYGVYIAQIQNPFLFGQVQQVTPLSQKWRTFTMQIFTQPSPGQAESRLSENLHCKSPPFLTKWWDL